MLETLPPVFQNDSEISLVAFLVEEKSFQMMGSGPLVLFVLTVGNRQTTTKTIFSGNLKLSTFTGIKL